MAERKIIAVVGATGTQGGSLVRAILADRSGAFAARAITRNPDSEKAKALASAGAEVVAANFDDEASLRKAFNGAHGAFCVTFFWDHLSADREVAEAAKQAEAARQAGVPHVIWSTLEDTRAFIPVSDPRMPTLQEKYKVPHFDGKGEANRLFTGKVPVTLLDTSFYWDNFIHFGLGPTKGPDGVLAITFPMGDKRLPGIAAEDIGKCALGVFKGGREYIGRTLGIAGGMLTGREMAAGFSRILGHEVRYNDVPPDVYRSFPFPGADEMGNMFQFKRDFEEAYCGGRSLELSRTLNPDLLDFDTWLKRHKKEIAQVAGVPLQEAAGM